MKHKHILLISAVAFILSGCGQNTAENDDYSFYSKLKEVDSESSRTIIQKKINKYLFTDLKEKLTYTWEGAEGRLSNPAKDLVKRLWSNLEAAGFSGYTPLVLNQESLTLLFPPYDVVLPAGGAALGDVFRTEEYRNLPFHTRVVDMLYRHFTKKIDGIRNSPYDGYNRTLLGLKYNNQYIYLAPNGPLKKAVHPGAIEHPSYILNFSDTQPNLDDLKPGTIVPEATLKEWNQVFIDVLKTDPFFKQFFEAPTTPTDASGSTSALAALKGKSGVDATQLMVNGVSGAQVDLGLPMYVQLKGSVDQGKSTDGMTGFVAYKLGSSVLGVIQSYANAGTGFTSDSRLLETSVIAAHSFGVFFVEGQLGSISATDVNFKDWSGVRSQVRLGIDTPFGAPFVQVTHRDFGHTSDTAGYVGFEIANSEFKAESYAFSTSLLTKVGHHSVHDATGSIDWTAALNLNSGVAFTTHLTLGSAAESKVAINLSLDR
jgi:hypothetical protein